MSMQIQVAHDLEHRGLGGVLNVGASRAIDAGIGGEPVVDDHSAEVALAGAASAQTGERSPATVTGP